MAKTAADLMADAIALFEKQGVKVTKEMREALVMAQTEEIRGVALETLARKTIETADREAWLSRLIELGDDFAEDFKGEVGNIGRGRAYKRMVRIEVPAGSLKIELTSETDE